MNCRKLIEENENLLKKLERSNDAWIDEKAKSEGLQKEIKILELKNRSSLANNLCPDHRDKQAGKSCLACEIDRLQNKL